MDLDLNQESLEPSQGSMLGLGSFINELETAHGRIDERIRRLEAVTSSTRGHQTRRQPESTDQVVDIPVVSAAPEVRDGNGPITAEDSAFVQERMVTNGRNGKHYGTTFLIAKALATDMDDRKAENDGSGFFDCNICLDIPKDPILTCCGHLFCWPCFYQLSYAYSNVKECPACNGEVTDTGVTPIYGNGNGDDTSSSKLAESGFMVPPRPCANRAEALRKQLISRGTFSAQVELTVQEENIVDAVQERIHQQEDLIGEHVPGERTRETADEIGSTVPPSASYTSSPVAAATAAHIVVDNHATNTVEINGSAAMSSSSRIQTHILATSVSDMENAMRISSNFAPSSSRRRTEAGLSDMDGGVSHEPRRRRTE
ncbi:uncharacterized protein LOC120000275 isoform X2 [Tripterygium wilfordii]|uniref:uncharacterized protein LOC120000275 isoform X2 n=1 Tax=Tripterygium wilfordii TaxID=458696 RepID=UPI0018F7F299|nr:uncharacterized protein LOC120000275 isoform X2 [Tripterygium wilfordii]